MAATGTLSHLLFACAVFVLAHMIPATPKVRARLIFLVGKPLYLIGYALLSICLLIWVVAAYYDAPYYELWPRDLALRWVPVLAMGPAVFFLVTGLTSANPFSLGLGGEGFKPEQPGVLRVTRHPLLWALLLWSGSHMVPNGHGAALIVFGFMTAMTAFGLFTMERKARDKLGAEWESLSRNTAQGLTLQDHLHELLFEVGLIRIGASVLLYGVIIENHLAVIGADPWP